MALLGSKVVADFALSGPIAMPAKKQQVSLAAEPRSKRAVASCVARSIGDASILSRKCFRPPGVSQQLDDKPEQDGFIRAPHGPTEEEITTQSQNDFCDSHSPDPHEPRQPSEAPINSVNSDDNGPQVLSGEEDQPNLQQRLADGTL